MSRSARTRRADDGFSLAEVMVAAGVFVVIGTAVSVLLIDTLRTTQTDQSRVRAASVAAKDLEAVRADFRSPSEGASTFVDGTTSTTVPVDGQQFTVARTVQHLAASGTQSARTRVSIRVSWPTMRGVQPVVNDTILTEAGSPVGSPGSVSGSGLPGAFLVGAVTVTVTGVTGGAGLNQSSLQVTLSGPSGVVAARTNASGVATFANLLPGTYTASLSAVDYLDPAEVQTPSRSLAVVANAAGTVAFEYDKKATLNLTLPVTQTTSAAIPVTIAASNLAGGRRTIAGSSAQTRSTATWAPTTGVAYWGGGCADADPSAAGNGGSRQVIAATPNTTSAGSVTLAPVTARVTGGILNAVLGGARVVATHRAAGTDAGCPSGETYTFPDATGSVTGTTRWSLPYGTWQLSVAGRSPKTSWPVVTLKPGVDAGTITVATS